MENKYTIDYFIKKFEAIPDDRWIKASFSAIYNIDAHCALGHCGMQSFNEPTEEAKALAILFNPHMGVTSNLFMEVAQVNDLFGINPKQNILKKLYRIKEQQSVDAQTTLAECGEGLNGEDQVGE